MVEIFKRNKWEYIITLKDGNLPSVWEEARLLTTIEEQNKLEVKTYEKTEVKTTKHRWITGIDYNKYILNWIETKENEKKYVFVTSLKTTDKTVTQISFSGRLRWKIENEGFNEQKNGGYGLSHKYSEVSLNATKNYYQSATADYR